MTKKAFLGLFAFTMLSAAARADILNLDFGEKGKETKIYNINIAKTGKTVIGHDDADVTAAVAALRIKDIVFLHPKIYVAQFLVSDVSKFNRSCDQNGQPTTDNASLKSLNDEKVVAVRLDYVHDVTTNQFDDAFNEQFRANNIDANAPAIAQFLDTVNKGGDVSAGESWEIVIQRLTVKDDKGNPVEQDTLTFQDAKGNLSTIQDADLISRIFSLWMGNISPNDTGLQKFKKELLCGN